MHQDFEIAIAISFGGTKIAVALVDCLSAAIVTQSERIEWSQHVGPRRSIGMLVAETTRGLLHAVEINPAHIRRVGIAWPGPGDYDSGEVRATFVPGFETSTNVFSVLAVEFGRVLGNSLNPIEWRCYLDASARARGELFLLDGALNGSTLGSHLVVNLATGIAGALVRDGNLVTTLPGLGKTYGQWGRFLILNRNSTTWQWRPTIDGSVPRLDPKTELRLTEVCGGPALAKSLAERCIDGSERSDMEILLMARKLISAQSRSVNAERAILVAITGRLSRGDDLAVQFVRDTGRTIGAALKCLQTPLGIPGEESAVVLTGGIGENFGLPSCRGESDLLLISASEAFTNTPDQWKRSRLGLSAELLGAVL